MRRVHVTTCQGIGDIFWTYQKLAPHYDEIKFNVLIVESPDPAMQRRADEFLGMLPKSFDHQFTVVDLPSYLRVAAIKPKLPELIDRHWYEYCVNGWLEAGVNLYEIDPGMLVEQYVPLVGVPQEAPRQHDALCLFVAGSKRNDFWSMHQWATAGAAAARALGVNVIHLIGAAWDRKEQEAVQMHLMHMGFMIHNHVGTMSLAESIDTIRSCRAFVGFQSGLNVIAENYGVPQLMVYFDEHEHWQRGWCRPDSQEFHSMVFKDFGQLGEKLSWLRNLSR